MCTPSLKVDELVLRLTHMRCRSALQAEKELVKALSEKEPIFAEITHSLTESVFPSLSPNFRVMAGLIVADFVWLVRMLFFWTSKPRARRTWKPDYGTLTLRSTTDFARF